ncbi:MAG: hypothetical protein NAG76_22305 [Candidatus Pristimantibacillus lignocellulolyticus]|uniref:Uncharacterized protein n=1 Tax=Candidatus Pristimantibacillus lignocellulolyticus TaxID=2994561 RepID=A0A9J6ZEC8_9BACL|nr:MAG: hypothetical protein NAG76_22305 [Candidatus Pristimantibacillus lignocellulolyticus]
MEKQEAVAILNQIDIVDSECCDETLYYAYCEDIEGNREMLESLGFTSTEIEHTTEIYGEIKVIDLSQIAFRWVEWFEEGKWWLERPKKCGWCDSLTTEVSHPHMFDAALGEKMCKECWNHDREVYKGSYGEDIGEFVAIAEGESSE